MNSKQRLVLIPVVLVTITAVIVWGSMGFHMFTKQQIPVREVDELFGTTTLVWKDVFILGLDIIGPVIAATLLIGTVLIFLFRTRRSAARA